MLLDLYSLGPFPNDQLAGTTTGVGNVTAALSVKHNLATGPTGVGNATAALSVAHVLTTTPTGVGRAVAALTVARQLSTTPTGVGSATATLSLTHLLAATVAGVAAVTSDLSGGSSVAPPDGTGTGWWRRQFVPPSTARRQEVLLATRAAGIGNLTGRLSVWSPAFTSEELASIAALVDEEDLAVLLTV